MLWGILDRVRRRRKGHSAPVLGLICNQRLSQKRECPGSEVWARVWEEPASICRDRASGLAKHLTDETSNGSHGWATGSKDWETAIEAGS